MPGFSSHFPCNYIHGGVIIFRPVVFAWRDTWGLVSDIIPLCLRGFEVCVLMLSPLVACLCVMLSRFVAVGVTLFISRVFFINFFQLECGSAGMRNRKNILRTEKRNL